MLHLEADAQVGRTPYSHGQTSTRGSLAGTSSKLRDSCHACAMSKVKCPKEKPSCSRCESRDITCQYFFTRRPGRRRENSTSHRLSNTGISTNSNSNADTDMSHVRDRDTILAVQNSHGTCLSGSTTPPSSLSWSNSYLGTSPSLSIATSPRPDNVFVPNSSDVFPVLGDTSMFAGLADFGSEVSDMDFVISAKDPPFGLPMLNSDNPTHTRNDIESLLIPAEGISHVLTSSETSSATDLLNASSGVSSLASNVQGLSTWRPSATRVTDTPSCGCLTQALDLLKILSSPQSSHATFPSPDATATSNTINVGSAQTVLMENKQSIEAVSRKLACSSCAWDSFLLAVLSMIVLKILERYAAAARTQLHGTRTSEAKADKTTRLANNIISSSKDHIRVLSRTYNVPCGDNGCGLMAAQLVLSELHRVQRLVNQLSPKLKGPKEGEGRNLGPELDCWGHHKVIGDGENMTMAPFSASTLDQMESDVRKRLSTLSAEIINGLRQS